MVWEISSGLKLFAVIFNLNNKINRPVKNYMRNSIILKTFTSQQSKENQKLECRIILIYQFVQQFLFQVYIIQVFQKNMLNEMFVSPLILDKLRQQLVPNYGDLDTQTQKQINVIITQMISNKDYLDSLSQISERGVLQSAPLLRSHLWKLMLGVLDKDFNSWTYTRKKNGQLYRALKQKFFSTYVDEDDLLDIGSKDFDQALWDQIQLDTKRTHTNLNFFQDVVVFGKIYVSKPTRHSDMLTRILYVWGKTNSTVKYVQGMNQILAPLYYLEFQQLGEIKWDRESEVFFLFSALMSSIIDMHIKQMDDCESGIMGRMVTLNRYLRIVDGQLWQRMQREGIYPQYYSFRWLALFLAQQFDLHQTIILWDYILSYDGYCRFFFVYSLCVAILIMRKKYIMQNDFITSLPKIQKLKDIDVSKLIKQGTKIYKKYKKISINEKFNELTENNAKQQQLIKQQQNQFKQKLSSYADVLKNYGNNLFKMTYWNKDGK